MLFVVFRTNTSSEAEENLLMDELFIVKVPTVYDEFYPFQNYLSFLMCQYLTSVYLSIVSHEALTKLEIYF